MSIAIIGAGITGCMVARELSFFDTEVFLIEQHADVCSETSKANSAIVHAGFDAEEGSHKAYFNVLGSAYMEDVCEELGVMFRRNGSMVLAFSEDEKDVLKKLLENGKRNLVPELSLISGDAAREMEPNLSKDVCAALLAKSGGIVCPYTLTIKAAEFACKNGVKLLTESKVTAIEHKGQGFVLHIEGKESVYADLVINAAGLYADEVARMAGDTSIGIKPRKGEYMIYDKALGSLVDHTIFQVPSDKGKGVLVSPTVDGNLIVGPNANFIEDKADRSTTAEGLEEILSGAKRVLPMIDGRDVITSFTGLRAVSEAEDEDFIIGFSESVKGLINLAGIQSPGLTAAPAIAEYVRELVVEYFSEMGVDIVEKSDIVHFTFEDLEALIEKDPEYAKIICRCETVSLGEIKQAVQECGNHIKPTIDGIKRRTRAGMGRCQGGFCMPRVLEVISKEIGCEPTEVRKSDDGIILYKRTKGGAV